MGRERTNEGLVVEEKASTIVAASQQETNAVRRARIEMLVVLSPILFCLLSCRKLGVSDL